MKAILVFDIDDEHPYKDMNDLYNRLVGWKENIPQPKPMPKKRDYSNELADTKGNDMYMEGWNDCLEEIEK